MIEEQAARRAAAADRDDATDTHRIFSSHLTMCWRWASLGFPRVVVGSHRLASSMMWTETSDSALQGVELPWECFWLTFPNTLIRWSEGPDVPDWEVTNVFVSAAQGVLLLLGSSSLPNVAIWAESLPVLGDFKDQGPAAEMLANLVLGVCVDMTAHRPTQKRAASTRTPARVCAPTPGRPTHGGLCNLSPSCARR